MVSGTNSEHDSIVVLCVKSAYSNVIVSRSLDTLNQNFIDSIEVLGYNLLVRSTTGYASYSTLADSNSILFVMPSGSNDHIDTEITLGSIISTGCGVDSNITGYPIHFFDIDPVSGNQSSYSNGYIAGKIAYLADLLGITPQKVIYYAELLQTLGHDGYGKFNTDFIRQQHQKFTRKLYVRKK